MMIQDEFEALLEREKVELNTKVLSFLPRIISLMIKRKKSITFVKIEPLDILSKKILQKELQKPENIDIFLEDLINFEGFSEKELLEFMHVKELNFLYKRWNKEYTHSFEFLDQQHTITKKYNYFGKYCEFNLILELIEDFPYSYITFPKEEGVERFVFYFYIFNQNRKKEFIQLLKSCNLDEDLISLVEEQNPYEIIGGYAFGCSYKENKLIRTTLYPGFVGISKSKQNIEFINKYHNLKLKNLNQHMLNYGIDSYKSHREIKIYERDVEFKRKITSKDLFQILKGKFCDYVIKFREGNIYTEKYEFFCSSFEPHEKKVLEKYGLYDSKATKISIYIDNNNNIKHYVFYYNDL